MSNLGVFLIKIVAERRLPLPVLPAYGYTLYVSLIGDVFHVVKY
jgi:hypothetical protein